MSSVTLSYIFFKIFLVIYLYLFNGTGPFIPHVTIDDGVHCQTEYFMYYTLPQFYIVNTKYSSCNHIDTSSARNV